MGPGKNQLDVRDDPTAIVTVFDETPAIDSVTGTDCPFYADSGTGDGVKPTLFSFETGTHIGRARARLCDGVRRKASR